MSRYEFIGIVALLALIVVLPVYALLEPLRLDEAQTDLQGQYLTDGTQLYLENCAGCHGPSGAGVGAMPALDNLGPGHADPDLLFRTIALSPHGTTMAAWHVDEGGLLNNYQVQGLVTLILDADWPRVGELAVQQDMVLPTPGADDVDIAILELEDTMDPHECRACHDEPALHAERFGLNCSRCHTLDAWKPALLWRHTFRLDHGGEGTVSCQTCHTQNYAENTCYECHDHDPEDMEQKHAQEEIYEFAACVDCHPTGEEGEGELYRDSYQPRERGEGAGDESGSDAGPPLKQRTTGQEDTRDEAGEQDGHTSPHGK